MTSDQVRRWFDEQGWQLEPGDLRAALEERGADTDTIVELIDEGADRRRAQPAPRNTQNGTPPARQAQQRRQERQRDRDPQAPPQDLDAEERILSAALLSPGALNACREILDDTGGQFYLERNGRVWKACVTLADAGGIVDNITVADQLEKTGDLKKAGGRVRIHELAALVVATANATHYAKIVAAKALQRDQQRAALELADAALQGAIPVDLRDRVTRLLEPAPEHIDAPEAVDGGAFIFDAPQDADAIRLWGDDTAIGWAQGEGLMLAGPDGVGKTTLGQQIALARAGLRPNVLGMDVRADERRVLLIAADRPAQAARSMRRMVEDLDRATLDERMLVWRGPLPRMLNEDRTILVQLARRYDCGTIVIDSLKDVAVDLASDEAGGRVAAACQHAIANGVELLVMHHPRKPGLEQHRKPKQLSDVYGSRLIFGAFGSVIMLWGEPGDAIIELSHLKQPLDELGPWNIIHDHVRGHTTRDEGPDLIQLILNASTAGLTPQQAAEALFQKEDVSRNEIERARRRLERLVENGRLVKLQSGGGRGNQSIYLFNGPQEALQ